MEKTKKYIAPGAWFAMAYPAAWSEFEDGEGSFLFYNPDEWTGNFRISAYRGNKNYGIEAMEAELRENPSATQVRVGQWKCAYSKEMFQEGGDYYTQHLWVTGQGNTAFEITFTVTKGGDVSEAQDIIASLEARKEGMKYPAELIPVRLSEIYQINEAYEWVEKGTKELLKKDFQGTEADIDSMQQFVDQSGFPPKKKEVWLGLGIALCVILSNEVDGMEWYTLIDGNREAPVLKHLSTGKVIDPMKLVWSRVKAGQSVCLHDSYEEALETC